ncbi:hypothetical protein HAX54_013040 [Datura stramonium]|uniref:Secreted protein n=1 Tax=Datura stramonium TaxID=4076 RepID=A0ABS8TMH5_DATST|nr:hypothetical protein [Datura stramonium]
MQQWWEVVTLAALVHVFLVMWEWWNLATLVTCSCTVNCCRKDSIQRHLLLLFQHLRSSWNVVWKVLLLPDPFSFDFIGTGGIWPEICLFLFFNACLFTIEAASDPAET